LAIVAIAAEGAAGCVQRHFEKVTSAGPVGIVPRIPFQPGIDPEQTRSLAVDYAINWLSYRVGDSEQIRQLCQNRSDLKRCA
jgi:hypothetical protein